MLCLLLIRQVTVGDANYMDWGGAGAGLNNHYRTTYKGIYYIHKHYQQNLNLFM